MFLGQRMRILPVGDIGLTDEGDTAPSSGAPGSTHTYSNLTSLGPTTAALISWDEPDNLEIDSITWGGTAGTVSVQRSAGHSGSDHVGCAVVVWPGPQSGDLVIDFVATVINSEVTVVSLRGVRSLTATDTDTAVTNSSSLSLSALSSPGEGGIRLFVGVDEDDTASQEWTSATELADLDYGGARHTCAYTLGDDGSTVTLSSSGSHKTLVGASFR